MFWGLLFIVISIIRLDSQSSKWVFFCQASQFNQGKAKKS